MASKAASPRFVFIWRIRFLFNNDIRMSLKEVFVIKSNVTDDAKTICNDAKFIGVTEMSIDVHLLDCLIGSRMSGHGAISCFVRIIGIIKVMGFLKAFSCLIMRFAYLELFSVTQASIPEVSKIVMEALFLTRKNAVFMQLFAFRKRLIKRWLGGQKGLLRKCKIKTGQKNISGCE